MTPKEKASELVYKYSNVTLLDNYEAKQCALIAVDTVLFMASHWATIQYWNDVKHELEKL